MKYNRDLDGKTSLARNLRALRNFNITDRVFGRRHHLCRANRIGGQFRASAFSLLWRMSRPFLPKLDAFFTRGPPRFQPTAVPPPLGPTNAAAEL